MYDPYIAFDDIDELERYNSSLDRDECEHEETMLEPAYHCSVCRSCGAMV